MSTAVVSTPPQTPIPAAGPAPVPATQSIPDPPFGGITNTRRFTVDEYHELIRLGIVGEGEGVELLEGYLVLKMARGPEHDFAVAILTKRLNRMLPDEWQVRPQLGATMSDSEPEPDIAIARGGDTAFRDRMPGSADVAVLIEVSNTSLVRDTRDKARIYARDGVPAYWVVNIPDRRVEVFTEPSGPTDAPAYATRTEHPYGSSVPVILDGKTVGTIAVADLIS